MRFSLTVAALVLVWQTDATTPVSFPNLPTVTPTIFDPHAPDAQEECPGYSASNVVDTGHGLTADLTLAGSPCNVFGVDIPDLTLEVSYQARERLNVRIQPKYVGAANRTWFVLDDEFLRIPDWDGSMTKETSDLRYSWSNEPSFQFAVSRQDGEELFSTFGHKIVFENQFIELVTDMIDDYNVYGLAENIRNFRLGTNYTQTLFNADTADAMDANSYGSHPFYQETRYHEGKPSTAHGLYARNAHAQEWLLREKTITYRTIGGSIDLYFLSGQDPNRPPKDHTSSALEVFRQYQKGCVGLPAMQMFWTLGFHQSHWGWRSIEDLQNVVSNYSAAAIPLESIWNDIDVYDRYRIFSNDAVGYPSDGMHEFVEYLHSRGQHYVAIQDSNVYFPDPSNATDVDSYPPFSRGAEMNAFIRDPDTGYFYIGENWPGYSVWPDWLNPTTQQWWTSEVIRFHETIHFDGLWVDLNECQSFCSFSCGNVLLNSSPTTFSSADQQPLSLDSRNLNFPPYKINNAKPTKQIIQNTIALNAIHNDQYNTAEYDVHSLWSHGMNKATYKAIESAIPGKRPFIVARSTFAGSGEYAGHWGGDNEATWGAMHLSISQSFGFQMSGIPMFGVDTCGFAGNTTEELCARWLELSAFFPFFRNHYADGKHPQEAYVWAKTQEASRQAINIRYTLLNYLYTLFHYAHMRGDIVMRALAWEFPNDISLRDTDTQFMLGPSLLVTPVLEEGARSVSGVFPGIEDGTRWFDFYFYQEVTGVRPQENVTMSSLVQDIVLHIRGGSILPLQTPGYTTAATKINPYNLLVMPDNNGYAVGSLYLDDGESIEVQDYKLIEFSYSSGRLTYRSWGTYVSVAPLGKITFAGLRDSPLQIELVFGGLEVDDLEVSYLDGVLTVSGLEQYTKAGAWNDELVLTVY